MKTPLRDIFLGIFLSTILVGQFLPDDFKYGDGIFAVGAIGLMVVAIVKVSKGDYRKKNSE